MVTLVTVAEEAGSRNHGRGRGREAQRNSGDNQGFSREGGYEVIN